MADYQHYLKQLFNLNLFNGIKLGLENSQKLDHLLSHPSNSFKTIHVAGTNGKGSVSTKIAKGLELSHFKTGLFTSPHISTFRERVLIDGELMAKSEVARILKMLFEMRDLHQIPSTFFEMTTFMALQYFQEKKVDFAVLEAGLGGRLDATNIVQPFFTLITSIGFDHTEILGNSLEAITLEKAGIIKPFIPILIGPKVNGKLIAKIAKEKQSPFFQVEGSFSTYEEENNAIAKKALELLGVEDGIVTKALKAKAPCRFQEVIKKGKTVILDVAHNPDGLSSLFYEIKNKYPDQDIRLIFGISANKDVMSCLSIIQAKGNSFHLVEASNGRGIKVKELEKLFKVNVLTHDSVREAVEKALESGKPNEVIVICGTFFIMADALKALGLNVAEEDVVDLNEKPSLYQKK